MKKGKIIIKNEKDILYYYAKFLEDIIISNSNINSSSQLYTYYITENLSRFKFVFPD